MLVLHATLFFDMTVPSSSASASFCDDFPHDKVILAGNCGVGKTTLFLWFKEREFVEDIRPGTVAEQQRQWQRDGVDISVSSIDISTLFLQYTHNTVRNIIIICS